MAVETNTVDSGAERLKALDAARLQIEKQFGQGSLIKLGTNVNAAGFDVIPSGSILLDEALGIGGYPRGRIIEMYGPESSGKTTLALHAIAEAQKLGGIAAFIDAEHALDPIYAKNLGVNIDELWVSQPDTGEQALEIADSLIRSGAVDIIVIDSVAALTPQAEIEGEMGQAQMGLQARLMSQALRKLTATINKSKTILVFINQLRMKIGIMFGNPETTTGGNALKFYSSMRLDIRRFDSIDVKGNEDSVGNRVRVKVAKNKMAPPFKKVELDIYFGKGVSATASLLDAAVKHGFIDKKGAWYTTETEKVGQGKESAIAYLDQNPEFAKEVEKKIREKLFPGQILGARRGTDGPIAKPTGAKSKSGAASKGDPAGKQEESVTPQEPVESTPIAAESAAPVRQAPLEPKTPPERQAPPVRETPPEDLF
jgi:recombination protein RecA